MSQAAANRRRLLAQAHIAAKDLGLDEGTRRDFIAARFGGRRSCSDLNDLELRRLVEAFRECGWRPSTRARRPEAGRNYFQERLAYWKKEFPQHRAGMATPGQLAHIEARWPQVSTANEKHKALRSFLYRRFGMMDLRFLDEGTAHQVIEALKAMARRWTEPKGAKAIYD
jgi:hypothetical protein